MLQVSWLGSLGNTASCWFWLSGVYALWIFFGDPPAAGDELLTEHLSCILTPSHFNPPLHTQVFTLGILSVESTPAQLIIISYAFLNLVIVSSLIRPQVACSPTN